MAKWTKNLKKVTLVRFSVHEITDPAHGVVTPKNVASVGRDDGESGPLLVTGPVEGLGVRVLDRRVGIKQFDASCPFFVYHRHDLEHKICIYVVWCQNSGPAQHKLLLQIKNLLLLNRYEIIGQKCFFNFLKRFVLKPRFYKV